MRRSVVVSLCTSPRLTHPDRLLILGTSTRARVLFVGYVEREADDVGRIVSARVLREVEALARRRTHPFRVTPALTKNLGPIGEAAELYAYRPYLEILNRDVAQEEVGAEAGQRARQPADGAHHCSDGGGRVSFDTHADRSKKRNSSAANWGLRGGPAHAAGMLPVGPPPA
jgi:hypothetical protein